MTGIFFKRAGAAFVFGAGALALAACGGAEEPADAAAPTGSADAAEPERAETGALSEMTLGDEDAPVTVIEYASLTCPACAAFHEGVFPDIKTDYIDAGKVRFVFREFPTPPVDRSAVASMLARCAADKGGDEAYFLMLDSLFANQRGWAYGQDPRGDLLKIAAQAGIDENAFDACVAREELVALINENVDEAREKYNVRATPSFVIDGQLRQFSSVDGFSEALDEAIAAAESDDG